MSQITSLVKMSLPLGRQEIELQQIDFVAGGMSMMRVRIREGSRFTIFDIDPHSAAQWAAVMGQWAAQQRQDS